MRNQLKGFIDVPIYICRAREVPLHTVYADTLVQADLRGLDLRYANFKNMDLRGANFTGANLTEADFSGADLRGAILHNATCDTANFSGANLSNARFTNANLSYADLSRANLRDADLTGAHLNMATIAASVMSRYSGWICTGQWYHITKVGSDKDEILEVYQCEYGRYVRFNDICGRAEEFLSAIRAKTCAM